MLDHPVQTFELERQELLRETDRLDRLFYLCERNFAQFVPDVTKVFVVRVEVERSALKLRGEV